MILDSKYLEFWIYEFTICGEMYDVWIQKVNNWSKICKLSKYVEMTNDWDQYNSDETCQMTMKTRTINFNNKNNMKTHYLNKAVMKTKVCKSWWHIMMCMSIVLVNKGGFNTKHSDMEARILMNGTNYYDVIWLFMKTHILVKAEMNAKHGYSWKQLYY